MERAFINILEGAMSFTPCLVCACRSLSQGVRCIKWHSRNHWDSHSQVRVPHNSVELRHRSGGGGERGGGVGRGGWGAGGGA